MRPPSPTGNAPTITRCLCVRFEPPACGECALLFGEYVPYCRAYEHCRMLDDSQCVCFPITAISVRGFPCGLSTRDDYSRQNAAVGTLLLEPELSCDAFADELCVRGIFRITIADPIPGRTGSAQLSFLAPIEVEGTLCGSWR